MAHLVALGIVTRYVNYKDNDRILTIFTREHGRIDARARGCRRPKSPLLPCAQPFVYGEFQLYMGKTSASIDQCDVRESFYPLREDIHKLAAASAMLALTQQAIQEGEPNEKLFSLLYHSLSFLAYSDISPLDAALCFTLRYLKEIGICPSVTECAVCASGLLKEKKLTFSVSSGGMVCEACGRGGINMSIVSAEAMRRMIAITDAEIGRVKLPPIVRKELHAALERYCDYHIEKENKAMESLKSLIAPTS